MAKGTVKAVWNGPAGYALQVTGEELIPGETIVELPAGEAAESHNWEPLAAPAATKADLIAQAAELSIDVPNGANKADIQALIDAVDAGDVEPEAAPEAEADAPPAETPEESA